MKRFALIAVIAALFFATNASADEGRTIWRRIDVNGTAIDYEVAYSIPLPGLAVD